MDPLVDAIAGKILEQIDRTQHLIGFVRDVEWRPPIGGVWSCGEVLGHLLDCLGGVCAVLYTAHPERLAHFQALRSLPVNQACGAEEARERIGLLRQHLVQGFEVLVDADLERKLVTLFVPEGESVLTLLLGNLEHLINHKHQLFLYLKLAGVAVGTPDLYVFR